MAIKLIALDLDGTLLTTQKTIDEETKKTSDQGTGDGDFHNDSYRTG